MKANANEATQKPQEFSVIVSRPGLPALSNGPPCPFPRLPSSINAGVTLPCLVDAGRASLLLFSVGRSGTFFLGHGLTCPFVSFDLV